MELGIFPLYENVNFVSDFFILMSTLNFPLALKRFNFVYYSTIIIFCLCLADGQF